MAAFNREFIDLHSCPSLEIPYHSLPLESQKLLSLKRAQDIVRAYALTVHDIRTLSPRFWNLHRDPILCLDNAAGTLVTIQLNLVAGTLAGIIHERPDLRSILDKILHFDVSAQFCLTELDHGLDAINIETTATLLQDGSFELHTPHPGAAKFMPPTAPCGLPCVAVVFARLICEGTDGGVRTFLVEITDGIRMCPNITAKILPPRGGSMPVNHCLTYFDKVRLSPGALLESKEMSPNPRLNFLQSIWRVAVGSLSIATPAIPIMQIMACVAARYSQRRLVAGPGNSRMPIISFKTQYAPILIALAQSLVMDAFWNYATTFFSNESNDPRVRHAIAAVFKVIAIQHSEAAALILSERCGAQGLFEHNQICGQLAANKGAGVAEGDLLGLSIRLISEILLERYEMPQSSNSVGLLARHEQGLIENARSLVSTMGHHRSDDFNRRILPHCKKIALSIGHRMAYEAAVSARVDPAITSVYLASTIRLDEAWYSENMNLTQDQQFLMEDEALQGLLPLLDRLLEDTGIEKYVSAPIMSKGSWDGFVSGLEVARSGTISNRTAGENGLHHAQMSFLSRL